MVKVEEMVTDGRPRPREEEEDDEVDGVEEAPRYLMTLGVLYTWLEMRMASGPCAEK